MRYLVKARVKPGLEPALLRTIRDGTLGQGSIAGDEYLDNLQHARVGKQDTAQWVEVCYCATPLREERPDWEQYFDLLAVKNAHARKDCRHENGIHQDQDVSCDKGKLRHRLPTSRPMALAIAQSFLKEGLRWPRSTPPM